MTEPVIVCNVPRCSEQSIFSRYGMVGGRYWPMCPDHAREWLGDHIARLAMLNDALEQLPAAAQLTLIGEGVMTVDLDRLSALLDDALPGTWVAVNRQGEIRVVVPKGPQGQYTLAHPHEPEGEA